MGKRLSFTVDLSEVGCGCNAALYMVSMSYSTEVGPPFFFVFFCKCFFRFIFGEESQSFWLAEDGSFFGRFHHVNLEYKA